MQATVRYFDGTTGSGTVFLDDGTVLPFDHRAFDTSGLRLLRFGQRLQITVVDDHGGRRVDSLRLLTMPPR